MQWKDRQTQPVLQLTVLPQRKFYQHLLLSQIFSSINCLSVRTAYHKTVFRRQSAQFFFYTTRCGWCRIDSLDQAYSKWRWSLPIKFNIAGFEFLQTDWRFWHLLHKLLTFWTGVSATKRTFSQKTILNLTHLIWFSVCICIYIPKQ